jgi:hypothetical protein
VTIPKQGNEELGSSSNYSSRLAVPSLTECITTESDTRLAVERDGCTQSRVRHMAFGSSFETRQVEAFALELHA